MKRPLYFGCGREKGHYWWAADERGLVPARDAARPFEQIPIDGAFAPPLREEPEGVANLVHLSVYTGVRHPYTLLAFWDRSVDKRGACNSAFALPGTLSFDDAVAAARAAFPSVWARFQFPVVEWRRPGPNPPDERCDLAAPRPRTRPFDRGTCSSCHGATEASVCGFGCWHLPDHCWPCHHKMLRPGEACVAPHCPTHGLVASRAAFNRDHPELEPLALVDVAASWARCPVCEHPTRLVPPGTAHPHCADFVRHRTGEALAPAPDERLVTVCNLCLRASCWRGKHPCDHAKDAGTVELTRSTLAKLAREDERYWEPT